MTGNRAHARHDFDVPVEVIVEGAARPGRSVNISRGGIFVLTEPLPEFGTRLQLRIRLPGIPEECQIPCVVRWAKPGEGAGLQFEGLRAIEAWALGKLLHGLEG
jgi:hypothetical protein